MMTVPVDLGTLEPWEAVLWEQVSAQFHNGPDSIHGPSHWRRVLRNGLLLATRTGADPAVVRMFALFHDSRRVNDMTDPDHGARGAQYAAQARSEGLFALSDEQAALLDAACVGHTDGFHHPDTTVGTCWDADRLDLGRCGMIPTAKFMSNAFAREIAHAGSVEPFLAGAGFAFSPTRP